MPCTQTTTWAGHIPFSVLQLLRPPCCLFFIFSLGLHVLLILWARPPFFLRPKPSSFYPHGLGFLRIHGLGSLSYFGSQHMAKLNCCSHIAFISLFVHYFILHFIDFFYRTFVFSYFWERSKLFFLVKKKKNQNLLFKIFYCLKLWNLICYNKFLFFLISISLQQGLISKLCT